MWDVEFSDEVLSWFRGLSEDGRLAVGRIVSLLEVRGNRLRMPHSRALGDGLFELRFMCEGLNQRITYVFNPGRRVITLTAFHKQKQNERLEILRARRAYRRLQGKDE